MNHKTHHGAAWAAAICAALLSAAPLRAQAPAQSPDDNAPRALQADVDAIARQVEKIRGLHFDRPIAVEHQTEADFAKYVDAELDRQMPGSRYEYYGKVIRLLGLYNGPEIQDFRAMAKLLMTSQAAAYYDPATKKFYLLYKDMKPDMAGTIYSHELTHALQDQKFDLTKYLTDPAAKGLNDDETLARQSVVEGEATLVMTLWAMNKISSDPAMIDQAIKMQADMTMDMMRQFLKGGPGVAGADLGDLQKAVDAMDKIPRFMLDMMIGAYMKGMALVHEVHKKGWSEVDKLFTRPPASTEQVLHPEKWFADERPYKLAWAPTDGRPEFADWERVDTNTLGEIGFRMIFTEQKQPAELVKSASAGWDGDTYAVFKKKNADEWMFLLYTCWDDEKEAKEFADAYEKMLQVKYRNYEMPAQIGVQGRDVLITEGGEEDKLDTFHKYVMETTKSK